MTKWPGGCFGQQFKHNNHYNHNISQSNKQKSCPLSRDFHITNQGLAQLFQSHMILQIPGKLPNQTTTNQNYLNDIVFDNNLDSNSGITILAHAKQSSRWYILTRFLKAEGTTNTFMYQLLPQEGKHPHWIILRFSKA